MTPFEISYRIYIKLFAFIIIEIIGIIWLRKNLTLRRSMFLTSRHINFTKVGMICF